MYGEEENILKLTKIIGFTLFMMLLSGVFGTNTAILLVLCLIYFK